MPAPTNYNQSEREWLAKAKRMYALESEDGGQAIDGALNTLAAVLIGISQQKDVNTDAHGT